MRLRAAILALLCCFPAHAQERQSTAGIRVIAPRLVAPPQVDPSTLERIEPRLPLTPPDEDSGRAKPPRLFRPVATAAGRLAVAEREIELDALRIVPPERICEASDGGTWPCGMRARTAFRLWLRGRAVRCDFADGEAAGRARCWVSGEDAAAWLVAHGWALAEQDGPYVALERQARQARRGIFSGGPAPL